MLYRPKFCSPAMTAERKVFEYKQNGKYTFSCVCDGNEKIITAKLYIDGKKENVEDSDINLYPINSKGNYNIISVTTTNFSIGVGKEFTWQMELTGEGKDSKVKTPVEKTKIVNQPIFTWKEISNLESYILNSNYINTSIDFTENSYPVQYWYYEIYDATNIYDLQLIYQSNKIFSQEIGLEYDNFLNDSQYQIIITVVDTINQTYTTELSFTTQYDVFETTANFDYDISNIDNSVYLKWSDVKTIQAQAKNSNIDDNISIFVTEDDLSQNIYNLNEDNTLTISNLNCISQGIYGCIRLTRDNSHCKFEVAGKELLIEKNYTNDEQLGGVQCFSFKINNNEIEIDKIQLNADPGCWYSFYWHLHDNKLYINKLSSKRSGDRKLDYKVSVVGEVTVGEDVQTGYGFTNSTTIRPEEVNNNQSVSINNIKISGNTAEIAYVFILTEQDSGAQIDKLTKLNIQPYWGIGALASIKPSTEDMAINFETDANNKDIKIDGISYLLSLNFEDVEPLLQKDGNPIGQTKDKYLAGDPSFLSTVEKFVIKRKKLEDKYYQTIATLDKSASEDTAIELLDYGLTCGNTYDYAVFPVAADNKYLSPIYSKNITIDYWDKWILMVCDETENENEFLLNQIYLFDLNIKSGSMSNNSKKTIIQNFTPYPRVQGTPSCYWSGSLSGLLGILTPDSLDYVQTPQQLKDFKNLSLNNKRKFLKDRDGNLFEVEISGDLSIDNTDNLIIELKTKSLNWVEVGDASNASITLRPDNEKVKVLTEYGYINPFVRERWYDRNIWLNKRYWMEGV